MYATTFVALALSAASVASGHGKVIQINGDKGGNGTGMGILGGVVPRFGKNAKTELDTAVMGTTDPMKNTLGKTKADGKITVAKHLKLSMDLSGNVLPQVSNDGNGSITGIWGLVTSDGASNNAQGDLHAVIDPTGTGQGFSSGTLLTAKSNMVGQKGNVVQRSLVQRAVDGVKKALFGIERRATNVGADAKFVVSRIPPTKCKGVDPTTGLKGICLMKVVNNNGNGAFGNVFAFQMADDNAVANEGAPTTTPAAAGQSDPATPANDGKKKGGKNGGGKNGGGKNGGNGGGKNDGANGGTGSATSTTTSANGGTTTGGTTTGADGGSMNPSGVTTGGTTTGGTTTGADGGSMNPSGMTTGGTTTGGTTTGADGGSMNPSGTTTGATDTQPAAAGQSNPATPANDGKKNGGKNGGGKNGGNGGGKNDGANGGTGSVTSSTTSANGGTTTGGTTTGADGGSKQADGKKAGNKVRGLPFVA